MTERDSAADFSVAFAAIHQRQHAGLDSVQLPRFDAGLGRCNDLRLVADPAHYGNLVGDWLADVVA